MVYDQVTGVLSVDTRGVNRIDDTPDFTTTAGAIEEDDVALESLLLETRGVLVTDSQIFPPFESTEFQGRQWFGDFIGNFIQIGSVTIDGNLFLWPDQYDIAQLPSGLTDANFDTLGIATMPEPGVNSGHFAIGGGVTIVPEPSVSTLIAATMLILGFRLRSRRTSSQLSCSMPAR